jgi:hypothetical protein
VQLHEGRKKEANQVLSQEEKVVSSFISMETQ